MSDQIKELTKGEVKYLEQEQCPKNEHGSYIFISQDGKERIELSLFLYGYKQYLIENKILKEKF